MCFSTPPTPVAPVIPVPTIAPVMASPEKTAAENSSMSIDAARRGKKSLRIDLGTDGNSPGSGLSIPS